MRTSDTRLTPAMREAWFDIAMHLSRPLFGPDRNAAARRDQAKAFWGVASDMEALLPTGSPWSDEAAAKVANHWYRFAPRGEGGTGSRYVEQYLGIVRCLAMAHAVATREPGRLGWFDARAVEHGLRDMPGHGEEFRLLLERCLYGQVRTVGLPEVPVRVAVHAAAAGATPAPFRAVPATVPLGRVPAHDAPVVARLRTPWEPLPVRRYAGGFLRPLLEPGSWKPLGEEDLVEALSGANAWGDDPFRDPGDGGPDRCLPTDDLLACSPGPARGRRGPTEAAAAVGSVGTLLVVDGVVHRRTRCPRTVLAMVPAADGAGARYAACWTTGDLSSWQAQDVAFPVHGREPATVLLGGLTLPLVPPDAHGRIVAAWKAAGGMPAHEVPCAVEWVDADVLGFDPVRVRDDASSDAVADMGLDDDPPGLGRWPGREGAFTRVARGRGDLPGQGYVRAFRAAAADMADERDLAAGAMAAFLP